MGNHIHLQFPPGLFHALFHLPRGYGIGFGNNNRIRLPAAQGPSQVGVGSVNLRRIKKINPQIQGVPDQPFPFRQG